MKLIDQFEKLEKVFNFILITFTSAMFIIVVFNVFMRFIMNNSIGWADELSRFIFIWISFLGAVLAYKSDEHVGLSFVVDRIKSAAIREIFFVIQRVCVLVIVSIMTYYGYFVTVAAKNVSPALSIPLSAVYMIVPFCALIMSLISIAKIVGALTNKTNPEVKQ